MRYLYFCEHLVYATFHLKILWQLHGKVASNSLYELTEYSAYKRKQPSQLRVVECSKNWRKF